MQDLPFAAWAGSFIDPCHVTVRRARAQSSAENFACRRFKRELLVYCRYLRFELRCFEAALIFRRDRDLYPIRHVWGAPPIHRIIDWLFMTSESTSEPDCRRYEYCQVFHFVFTVGMLSNIVWNLASL
jgi:hypothetical protein